MSATAFLRVLALIQFLGVVACQLDAAAAKESDLAKQRQQFLKDIAHEFPPEIANSILDKARKFRKPARAVAKPLSADVVERLKTLKKEHEQDKNVEETVESIPQINRAFSDLLFEGDIVLPTPPQNATLDRRGKRQIVTGPSYPRNKWTPGVPIAYRFDSSIDSFTRNVIRIGVKYWQDNTCLSFEENGNNRPIIRFFKGQGCYSLAGKAFSQSEQDISIGDGCETFGNVAHEVAHALGVLHHHNRPDRDNYITVQSQNVAPGWERQYAKESYSSVTTYGLPYDYGSVMHYKAYDPATRNVIFLAKDKRHQHTMSSGAYGPVFSDLLLINKHYQCSDKCGANKCTNGGFPHPRNCNACICPNGFGGRDCSERAPGEGGAPASCGQTVKATSQTQTLNGGVRSGQLVGRRQESILVAGCHYHIQAPAGQRVEITVQRTSGSCTEECALGATEIKYEKFTQAGPHLCCPSHVSAFGTVVSSGNLAVVSAYSIRGEQAFTLQYRAVSSSGGSSNGGGNGSNGRGYGPPSPPSPGGFGSGPGGRRPFGW